MITSQDDSKVRKLKRLLRAHSTFQDVTAACKLLIDHDAGEDTPFYDIFFTGICVSYLRPFMGSKLGPLPPKYCEFPKESVHATTHEDLKKGRNCVHSHDSPAQAAELFADATQREEVTKFRFVLCEKGIPTFKRAKPIWPKLNLPAIVCLCQFQMDRIATDINKFWQHFSKDKKYKPGEYVIGETFP